MRYAAGPGSSPSSNDPPCIFLSSSLMTSLYRAFQARLGNKKAKLNIADLITATTAGVSSTSIGPLDGRSTFPSK